MANERSQDEEQFFQVSPYIQRAAILASQGLTS